MGRDSSARNRNSPQSHVEFKQTTSRPMITVRSSIAFARAAFPARISRRSTTMQYMGGNQKSTTINRKYKVFFRWAAWAVWDAKRDGTTAESGSADLDRKSVVVGKECRSWWS